MNRELSARRYPHDFGHGRNLDESRKEGNSAYSHSRRLGLSVRRLTEIPVPGIAGSGPFYEDRYSLASAYGAICRRDVNHLRVAPLGCVPLLIDICVALFSTKIVTFMKNGFWGTLHEVARM